MREDPSSAPTLAAEDVIIAGIQLRAVEACARWAHVREGLAELDADPVLYCKPEDPLDGIRTGSRLTAEVLRNAMWAVMLTKSCDLPKSLNPGTRMALDQAYNQGGTEPMARAHVSQLIQFALFGEVRY